RRLEVEAAGVRADLGAGEAPEQRARAEGAALPRPVQQAGVLEPPVAGDPAADELDGAAGLVAQQRAEPEGDALQGPDRPAVLDHGAVGAGERVVPDEQARVDEPP